MTIKLDKRISLDTYVVAFWLFYGYAGQFILSTAATQIKIISMVAIIVLYTVEHRRIVINSKLLVFSLLFIVWYLLDNIFHDGLDLGIEWSIPILSWIIPVMIICMVHRNTEELRLLLKVVVLASLIYSIMLLAKNDWFVDHGEVTVGDTTMNRNKVIDSTAPGLIILLIKFIKLKKIAFRDMVVAVIIFLACLQPNSRAMFATLVLSLLCLSVELWKNVKDSSSMKKVIFIIIVILLIAIILFVTLPSEYTDRLWDFSEYTLENSTRWHLWKKAFELNDSPIWGMGAHYYAEHSGFSVAEYGSHNLYIDLYVAAGAIASLLMVFVMLEFVIFDWCTMAMFVLPFMRSTVEAGRGYGVWSMCILLYIIKDITICKEVTADSLFCDIFMGV